MPRRTLRASSQSQQSTCSSSNTKAINRKHRFERDFFQIEGSDDDQADTAAAATVVEDIEMIDNEPAASTQSQSQAFYLEADLRAQREFNAMSDEDKEHKVAAIIRYMLAAKPPIERAKINKQLELGRCFQPLLDIVDVRLSSVFGLSVAIIDREKGLYALQSILNPELRTGLLNYDTITLQKNGLLMSVLSTIFMQKGIMYERQLWSFLRRLGIDKEERTHSVFGETKKILSEWVRSGWLTMKPIALSDPPDSEVSWGSRAHKCINERQIINFVCRVYKDKTPEDFSSFFSAN